MYVCMHARTYVCTYVYVVLHLFFVEGLLACIHMHSYVCVCMHMFSLPRWHDIHAVHNHANQTGAHLVSFRILRWIQAVVALRVL